MGKIDEKFISGLTKVGSRGQIVIPAEIRKKMGLKRGDHLFVFYHSRNRFINLMKADQLDQMFKRIINQISQLKKLRKNFNK